MCVCVRVCARAHALVRTEGQELAVHKLRLDVLRQGRLPLVAIGKELVLVVQQLLGGRRGDGRSGSVPETRNEREGRMPTKYSSSSGACLVRLCRVLKVGPLYNGVHGARLLQRWRG